MNARFHTIGFSALAVATLLLGGCVQGGPSGPTGTVSGKVTVAGQSAPAGVSITFMSTGGPVATGQTEADGTYRLAVAGNPNVPATEYKVMATAPAAPEMSQAEIDKVMSGGSPPPAAPSATIPAKYASTNTSGLSFTVKEGPNTIDIDLQ